MSTAAARPEALFLPEGQETFVPTVGAVGPWSPQFLHGGAVAALFAGRLAPADQTAARLTVEMLAPVPFGPLQLRIEPPTGGRRVRRVRATLLADGRPVASASTVTVVRTTLDLPAAALVHDDPFRDVPAPDLSSPGPVEVAAMGWENFHTVAAATKRLRVPSDPDGTHQWVGLTVPVVAGTTLQGIEVAAAAADFASEAVHRRLPFTEWSFVNAELTLHLARQPVGSWIGMNSSAVIQPYGTAIVSTQLFDAGGRVGQSASTLVVERRVGV